MLATLGRYSYRSCLFLCCEFLTSPYPGWHSGKETASVAVMLGPLLMAVSSIPVRCAASSIFISSDRPHAQVSVPGFVLCSLHIRHAQFKKYFFPRSYVVFTCCIFLLQVREISLQIFMDNTLAPNVRMMACVVLFETKPALPIVAAMATSLLSETSLQVASFTYSHMKALAVGRIPQLYNL